MMRYCPDCKAPNPVSRIECYACGQSLLAAPSSEAKPPPGERTYPCLTCQTAVPYSATVCPGCGRNLRPASSPIPPAMESGYTPQQAAAMNLVTLAEEPGGWSAESLPDGTVRLIRNGWQRLWRDARPLLVFGCIAFWLIRILAWPGRPMPPSEESDMGDVSVIVALGVIGVIALGWAIWSLFAREELRAGREFLEVRRSLGPLRSVRRMDQGVLRLDRRVTYSRRGQQIEWRLRVDGPRGGVTLDSREQSALWQGTLPDAELGQLGRYIAMHTGWPFVNPLLGG